MIDKQQPNILLVLYWSRNSPYAVSQMQYKWTALTVTTLGTLLTGIDSRIIVIGLPIIARQLRANAEQLIWVGQSYLLASTVCLLVIGRLSDLFGRVKLYTTGFLVFTLGSVLSALSFGPLELISFRVLQGVGAGLIQANSNAIVTDASPPNELGLMIGINQTSLRVGSISGLTLAGIILSLTDWRGLFYINIPIGIFATLWAHKRLREISVKDPSKKMDFVGFLLFSVGLTFLLLSITFLSYGAGDLTEAMGFLAAGAVLLAAFVIAQSKTVFPLLDLSLFRIKLFAAANLAQVLNSIVWSGLLVLFAFYLQIGLGYTAFEAGIAIAPLELAYVVSSLISAKLSDKYGSTILTSTGLVIITLSFVAASTFGESTHYWKFVIVLLFCGAGNGMFTPPNLRAIMGSVPAIRRGVAAGFRQTMFNSGSTCGYGLVILFLTFGIPYATLSPLIQGTISNGAISLARVQFFDGYRISCILFAIVDGLAIIPSVLRGHPSPQNAIARAETYQR